MKKLIVGLALFLVTACGILPAKFDSTEYSYYVVLYQMASRLQKACANPNTQHRYPILEAMNDTSEQLNIYVKHVGQEASMDFAKDTASKLTSFRKDGSKIYCEESADNFKTQYGIIMDTLGKRSQR